MFLNVNDQDALGTAESQVLWPKAGISPSVFCPERELLLLASHVTSDPIPHTFSYSSPKPCCSEPAPEFLTGHHSA